jgi:hypothetical protein
VKRLTKSSLLDLKTYNREVGTELTPSYPNLKISNKTSIANPTSVGLELKCRADHEDDTKMG